MNAIQRDIKFRPELGQAKLISASAFKNAGNVEPPYLFWQRIRDNIAMPRRHGTKSKSYSIDNMTEHSLSSEVSYY